MAMELDRYVVVNGIAPTPGNLDRVARIREAAVYLRARAYRRWHRSERDDASGELFGAALRASAAFELRYVRPLLHTEA